MNQEQREILRKKQVLEHAEATGNVPKTCRYFGFARSRPRRQSWKRCFSYGKRITWGRFGSFGTLNATMG